jgi:hypothetical protein
VNQSEFQSILDDVVEAEMQLYQDMAVLKQVRVKNERTRDLLKHSTEKLSVVEESQSYLLKMLTEIEKDLSGYQSMLASPTGAGFRGSERLF